MPGPCRDSAPRYKSGNRLSFDLVICYNRNSELHQQEKQPVNLKLSPNLTLVEKQLFTLDAQEAGNRRGIDQPPRLAFCLN
jgi:hypothetical protein